MGVSGKISLIFAPACFEFTGKKGLALVLLAHHRASL